MEKKKVFSCYCMFDVCYLSKSKKETFQKLSQELKCLMEKGWCKCSLCKSRWYRNKATWVLHTQIPETDYEIMYVVPIEHIERHIDQMTLSICQKMRATQACTLKESFEENYYHEYPSCFFFYQEDLITPYDFCLSFILQLYQNLS